MLGVKAKATVSWNKVGGGGREAKTLSSVSRSDGFWFLGEMI